MFAIATLPSMPRKPLDESQKKKPVASRVDPAIFDTIEEMALKDDRTTSYVIEKLLAKALGLTPKQHAPDRKRK